VPAEEYSVNIIVDPCRGHSHDCCQDVFGTPQYVNANYSRIPGTTSALQLVNEKGEAVSVRLHPSLVVLAASPLPPYL